MRDILATLTSSLNFRTFVNVLAAADLIDDLRATGPFLVRAPTDAAFDRVAPEQLRALFDDGNVEALVDFAERCVAPEREARPSRWNGEMRGDSVACRNGRIVVLDEVSLPAPRTAPRPARRGCSRRAAACLRASPRSTR